MIYVPDHAAPDDCAEEQCGEDVGDQHLAFGMNVTGLDTGFIVMSRSHRHCSQLPQHPAEHTTRVSFNAARSFRNCIGEAGRYSGYSRVATDATFAAFIRNLAVTFVSTFTRHKANTKRVPLGTDDPPLLLCPLSVSAFHAAHQFR